MHFGISLGCTNKKNLSKSAVEATPEMIMVLLKDGIDPVFLEKNIIACQLKVHRKASKSQNKWLFNYACFEDEQNTLLAKILDAEYVLEAYFVSESALEKSSGTSGKKGKAKPAGN
jgi:hypothetical protein